MCCYVVARMLSRYGSGPSFYAFLFSPVLSRGKLHIWTLILCVRASITWLSALALVMIDLNATNNILCSAGIMTYELISVSHSSLFPLRVHVSVCVCDLLCPALCARLVWGNAPGRSFGSLGLGIGAIQHLMIHTRECAKHTHTHTETYETSVVCL